MPYYRTPHRSPRPGPEFDGFETPMPVIPAVIHDEMNFAELCETLKAYFTENIDNSQTLNTLKLAVSHLDVQLTEKSYNPSTVAALLWCRAEFASSDDDGTAFGMVTIGSARALACEMVACDLTSNLSAAEALQYLCHELPVLNENQDSSDAATETSHLLHGRSGTNEDIENGRKKQYEGMNTLEIAVLADAKKFISHRPVQKIINGIWDGSISFWKSLDVDGSKSPHFFNPRTADPFCRLRVPKYQKTFEALFFAALLGFYFAVLVERNPYRITASEIALIVFFAAFAVDGFSSMRDSGVTFYNVWSWLDMAMIMIGVIFLIYRIIGVVKDSDEITDTAFDVLSLVALLLVPRNRSINSVPETNDEGDIDTLLWFVK
ncbi:hypothetical protein K440DRAFT_665146 [Wilcoxina mikolae CBS 423.85]|nr:hypothetical protein K440DRAFT_665146 [Wilcoxina mikolae CBS 423.85]